MNTKTEIALSHFCEDFDQFLVRCHDLEMSGKWSVSKYGLMSTYFESDLFAVLLQLMSADGVFERAEADVINQMFSTEYSARDLSKFYKSLGPVVNDYVDEEATDAMALLSEIDPELRDDYRKLMLDACNIISMSDGVAEGEERALIEKLTTALEG
jgi:tellurite resistance protein